MTRILLLIFLGLVITVGCTSPQNPGLNTQTQVVIQSADNHPIIKSENESAGWQPRASYSSVVMPDSSIVLMGGVNYSQTPFVYKYGHFYNDVWKSTDNGKTWKEVNASAGWSPRWGQTSIVMPEGSIILMGGEDGSYRNDVWRSADHGETWTLMNASAGWAPRIQFCSVVTLKGSIILMGGADYHNDVWRSTDEGATWTLVTDNATWTGRNSLSCEVKPNGNIILTGGTDISHQRQNDVWLSKDEGATWTQIKTSDYQVR